MRIKIDENLPIALVDLLQRGGHDADTVEAEHLSGADDPTVLAAATADRRALLTLDKELADVRVYPLSQHGGVILLRPRTTNRGDVLQFMQHWLPQLPDMDPRGRLSVISDSGIRLR